MCPSQKMIGTWQFGFWVVFALLLNAAHSLKNNGRFPPHLLFGAATAAYQIEGAWNEDGKGESIWDRFVHQWPSPITNNDTGDVACDSYHRWKEDVHLAAALGLNFYRISISWPRILPYGYSNYVNRAGLNYYRNLIQEIVRCGMVPIVTLFHWDFPQRLQEDGLEWTNPALIPIFIDYARLIIRSFPEVDRWITINEPRGFCLAGYALGVFAPGVKESGTANYQCSYVMLKAHAAVYHMYKKEFPNYTAKMSITIDCQWYEPETNDPEDIEAAERQQQFECGMYYHPIFVGDWPELVKYRIAQRSYAEGYPRSRLPAFTPQEIAYIRGTYDYLAVNHYFTFLVSDEEEAPCNETDYENDVRTVNSRNPNWELGSNQWGIVPWGVRRVLNWLKNQYGDQNILITEIGVADDGSSLEDDERIDFYTDYYCEILEAIQVDGVNVLGITAWSLMDDFEWSAGYSVHFGLYQIDFYNDCTLTRRPKKSVRFFQNLTKTRQLECSTYNRDWPAPSWGPHGKRNRRYWAEQGYRGYY